MCVVKKKLIPVKLLIKKKIINKKEIRKDTISGKQMNRLLQGDVGSGKTVIALFSMLLALDNKQQACLMAPTEILAAQHFQTITSLLSNLPVNVTGAFSITYW